MSYMFHVAETLLLLDEQDPRQHDVPLEAMSPPHVIWAKRMAIVEALLRIIDRAEPMNTLRRKALAVRMALHQWKRENQDLWPEKDNQLENQTTNQATQVSDQRRQPNSRL